MQISSMRADMNTDLEKLELAAAGLMHAFNWRSANEYINYSVRDWGIVYGKLRDMYQDAAGRYEDIDINIMETEFTSKAIESQVRNKDSGELYSVSVDSLEQASRNLHQAFAWNNSAEGYEYWSKVHNKLNDMIEEAKKRYI